MTHPQLAARSPYYGIFLYVTERVGSLWFTTAIQAALAAALTWISWQILAPRAPRWTAYAVQGAVAAGSTLPFFASFAMPDVFAGFGVLSAALLLAAWGQLSARLRISLALLLVFCAAIHGSNGLVVSAMLVLGTLAGWLLKKPRRALIGAALTVAASLAGAVAANAIYMKGVEIQTGDTPGRPPFLTARLLADGPGRAYLRWACDHGQTYVLCPYRRLPLDNSEDFLWRISPKYGVFNRAGYHKRLAIEAEQSRFALHVLAYDPVGVGAAAMENWGRQLLGVYADDPLRDPYFYLVNKYWSQTNLPWLIDHNHGCGPSHHDCKPRLRFIPARWLHGILFVLAMAAIGWRLTRLDVRTWIRSRFPADAPVATLLLTVGLVLGGVVANALVCGALSGPYPRYQARLVWTVTVVAACAMASLARPDWTPATRAGALLRRAWATVKRPPLDPDVLRYALVGGTGFLIDRLVLELAIRLGGLDHFTGRLVSFSVAVAATLMLNRRFTFRHPHAHSAPRQAVLYAGVQGAGGLLNLGCYMAAILLLPVLKQHLIIPLAIGSAAGLSVTYLGSKHIAFRPR